MLEAAQLVIDQKAAGFLTALKPQCGWPHVNWIKDIELFFYYHSY